MPYSCEIQAISENNVNRYVGDEGDELHHHTSFWAKQWAQRNATGKHVTDCENESVSTTARVNGVFVGDVFGLKHVWRLHVCMRANMERTGLFPVIALFCPWRVLWRDICDVSATSLSSNNVQKGMFFPSS